MTTRFPNNTTYRAYQPTLTLGIRTRQRGFDRGIRYDSETGYTAGCGRPRSVNIADVFNALAEKANEWRHEDDEGYERQGHAVQQVGDDPTSDRETSE